MKRFVLFLFFISPTLAQTPVTVTGLITDAGNNPATSGTVTFTLTPNASSIHYFVLNVGTITQTVTCGIDGTGHVKSFTNLANPCTVWGNDVINPANTQYKITFAPNGNITNTVNGECIISPTYNLNSPVFCPIIQLTPQQIIIRSNPYQVNILPSAGHTFNIGSPLLPYAAVYADNLFLNGAAFSPSNLVFLNAVNNFTNTNNFGGTTNFNGPVNFAVFPGFPSQAANTFLAAPNGAPGSPTPRLIVGADMPPVNLASSSNGGVNGNLPVTNLNGGSGASPTTCWHGDATWSSCTGGAVTSVGLALPVQFNVSNSPVTSSGVLAGAWQAVPSNYILAGPALNSIGGIYDGTAAGTGNSALTSLSDTPTTSHDWAFVALQTSGQAGAPTMPGGWTKNFNPGNNAAVWNQVFSTNALINAPVTLATSAQWAEILFMLRLPGGSPTIVQSQSTTGAFTTSTNTFGVNVTAGNSIIAIFCGIPTVTMQATFADVQRNIYTTVAVSSNGLNAVCIAALTSTILGGTTDPVTVTLNGLSTGSFFLTMEVSNIAAPTSEPVFRALQAGDFPANISGPPIQVFSNVALGGNVTINNTNTTVASRVVTMPTTGCPCRAFLSYSLAIDFAGVTNQPNIDFWVSDGTNVMAGVETGQSNATTGARTSATYGGYSLGTYANGAVITFTLIGIQPGTAGAVVHAAPSTGSGPNSSFQVAVSTSN